MDVYPVAGLVVTVLGSVVMAHESLHISRKIAIFLEKLYPAVRSIEGWFVGKTHAVKIMLDQIKTKADRLGICRVWVNASFIFVAFLGFVFAYIYESFGVVVGGTFYNYLFAALAVVVAIFLFVLVSNIIQRAFLYFIASFFGGILLILNFFTVMFGETRKVMRTFLEKFSQGSAAQANVWLSRLGCFILVAGTVLSVQGII